MSTPGSGKCDACNAIGVERARYRVIRATHDETSRSMLLCNSCRAPLEVLLKTVGPKVAPAGIVVCQVSELLSSPTLKAQATTKRKGKLE